MGQSSEAVLFFGGYWYLRAMSKRAFKKFLSGVPKSELEIQLLDLYERFPQVKRYFDFIFDPREEKLIQEAKSKISNEYFPLKRKRPRARRSVAQRYLRQYRQLGMAPYWVAELMVYNLETAQRFSARHKVPEAFYKSMLNSFTEMLQYIVHHQLLPEYRQRIMAIESRVREQEWGYRESFENALDAIGPNSE
jgi:hypothetical protein